MDNMGTENRIQRIRAKLKVGDISRIAQCAGVHRVWVCYVLAGKGTSARVLQAAEQFLIERERSQTNRLKVL